MYQLIWSEQFKKASDRRCTKFQIANKILVNRSIGISLTKKYMRQFSGSTLEKINIHAILKLKKDMNLLDKIYETI
jgi:hypothetical protein